MSDSAAFRFLMVCSPVGVDENRPLRAIPLSRIAAGPPSLPVTRPTSVVPSPLNWRGAQIVVNDRNHKAGEPVRAMFDRVAERHCRLDILVISGAGAMEYSIGAGTSTFIGEKPRTVLVHSSGENELWLGVHIFLDNYLERVPYCSSDVKEEMPLRSLRQFKSLNEFGRPELSETKLKEK